MSYVIMTLRTSEVTALFTQGYMTRRPLREFIWAVIFDLIFLLCI